MSPICRSCLWAVWVLVIGGFVAFGNGDANGQPILPKRVRVVYLTPSDKQYVAEYDVALGQAIIDLRRWVADQMNGFTFSVSLDSVEWYQTSHPVSFYQTAPNSFWGSVLDDAFALTGGKFNDPNNRWLFYIDADPLAGQAVGGVAGVALFPANDLRGLNGGAIIPINPGDTTVNPGFDRWVGGMGHELGHAFGLDHPPDSPGGLDDNTLMFTGYANFPNTYLRTSDKSALLESSFFSLAGDFDGAGDVDGRDFLKWQRGESTNPLSASDLADWQAYYGQSLSSPLSSVSVPEPSTGVGMILTGAIAAIARRRTIIRT